MMTAYKIFLYKFNKVIPLVLGLLLFMQFSYAQTVITGKVSDTNGEDLIGASVLVKGTSVGTVSDFDGTYSLSVPTDAITLVYSYTGYTDQEVEIGSQTVINVILEEGIALDEVIVVGYSKQKKVTVTGAVTALKGPELTRMPSSTYASVISSARSS